MIKSEKQQNKCLCVCVKLSKVLTCDIADVTILEKTEDWEVSHQQDKGNDIRKVAVTGSEKLTIET